MDGNFKIHGRVLQTRRLKTSCQSNCVHRMSGRPMLYKVVNQSVHIECMECKKLARCKEAVNQKFMIRNAASAHVQVVNQSLWMESYRLTGCKQAVNQTFVMEFIYLFTEQISLL